MRPLPGYFWPTAAAEPVYLTLKVILDIPPLRKEPLSHTTLRTRDEDRCWVPEGYEEPLAGKL